MLLRSGIVISPARIMYRIPAQPIIGRTGRPCSSHNLCLLLSAALLCMRCSITHYPGHRHGGLGCRLRRLPLTSLQSATCSESALLSDHTSFAPWIILSTRSFPLKGLKSYRIYEFVNIWSFISHIWSTDFVFSATVHDCQM